MLVKKYDVQVIHCNNGAPSQWLVPVARTLSLPLLIHLHTPYLLRDRITLGLHQSSLSVGVSRYTVEKLLDDGVPKSNINVIYNGIDFDDHLARPPIFLRQYLGIDQDSFILISVGSLIRRKGYDLILKAVSILVGRSLPLVLVIIGGGVELNNLRVESIRLGISNRVHFLGERPDAISFLKGGADLFVSGARDEAFGLVLGMT